MRRTYAGASGEVLQDDRQDDLGRMGVGCAGETAQLARIPNVPSRAAFLPQLAQIPPDARVSAEDGFPSHLSERRYIYDYGFGGFQDAQWVVLDYEGTNYDLPTFEAQVASVEAAGYDEVASGYGLALLHKRLQ